GVLAVPLEQALEVLHVRLHGFRVDAADVDELVVVAVDEIALQVQHVGEAAGEAGAKVDAGAAEHAHRPAGHVLAAVIAGALDDRERSGVTHREALPGDAGRVQLTAGGTVQAGVAHDHRVARQVARRARMPQHDAPARHALADVVVGVALQIEMQAAGVPDSEALPGVAAAAHGHGRVLHAVVAPAPRDLARQARADRAVVVGEPVAP